MRKYLLLPLLLALVISCNKDDVITQENENPLIELDSETGVYVVKVGKEVKVNPTYSNVDFAVYSWKYNGRIISDSPSLTYTFNQSGSYYVTIRVDTPKGSSEEEIRMEVNELAPPVISLVVPTGGLNVLAGREHKITPDSQNAEGAIFRWTLNGKEVGTTAEYTFNEQELGSYKLVLYAKNEDGDTSKEVVVNVVDKLSADATIVAPSFYTENLVKTVALGRTLYLRPYVNISSVANYQWSLDGEPISGANSLMYAYTPEAKGEHTLTFALSYGNSAAQKRITRNISVTGTDKISLDIPVACIDASEKRPYTEGCSLNSNKVYEFIPAPGQFVNETNTAGYTGTESTQEAAIAYAENRLATTSYVSLGGWGGYIVVGFDHSIENKGGYDFSIIGNAFEGSSEPGIVWVMQDVNGNQLPDDEWYELKGSEYGKNGTIQDYAVTYYRPGGAKMATQWADNQGNVGEVDYLGGYHPQAYYYPLWIKEDSYTLYGTRLKSKTVESRPGFWENRSFEWGYADNVGDDMPSKDNPNASSISNYFKISDAVNLDGSSANLTHIDFIKVQTGVNAKAGWLGENSTEVYGFTDENNKK